MKISVKQWNTVSWYKVAKWVKGERTPTRLPMLDSTWRWPRNLPGAGLVMEAWYLFAPPRLHVSVGGWGIGGEESRWWGGMGWKDLGVWTFRVTCSAKLLKLQKETKKQHQLKSTENCFPLGQGARISGWPGPVRPLGFYSELTQVPPETWIVMRATLWGSKPPAHCETANTTISEQKQKQQGHSHRFWRA